MTTPAFCSPSQFSCNNGNCVPSYDKCNTIDDCRDNSDEFGCGKVPLGVMVSVVMGGCGYGRSTLHH